MRRKIIVAMLLSLCVACLFVSWLCWGRGDGGEWVLFGKRFVSAATIHCRKLDLPTGQVVVLSETEIAKQRDERTAP